MRLEKEWLQLCFSKTPMRFQDQEEYWSLSPVEKVLWKGKSFQWEAFNEKLHQISGANEFQIENGTLKISKQFSPKHWKALFDCLENIDTMLAQDNLGNEKIWYKPKKVTPFGFNEKEIGSSHKELEKIYKDQFIVAEKKPFILDLDHSKGAYFISMAPERSVFIDAAAQISTLGLGLNDSLKQPMLLRSEILEDEFDLEQWDVTRAYRTLLRDETGLPYVYFVNSGAEAVETALQSCQMKYPDRRNVLAFEGSFHGRSLLALHATYNPSKREPFQFFPENIHFAPFPEQKNIWESVEDPQQWRKLWSQKGESEFQNCKNEMLSEYGKKDLLLLKEIECLEHVRKELLKRPYLAVVIEPMQCEGGDCYASSRFFRGLRLLTRALDVSLIMDEVQTGIGLGENFFWHKYFQLIDEKGNPDYPDAVSTAKRAQVGVCITQFEIPNMRLETSSASLLRGLIHSYAVKEFDSTEIFQKVKAFLFALQEAVGREIVQSPRAHGLAFAFDLPTPELMNALVAERFLNGTLFYPAGERTARFRLMVSTSERELYHIFQTLYRCFKNLEAKKLIGEIPSQEEFFQDLFPDSLSLFEEKPGVQWKLPWSQNFIPENFEAYQKIETTEWIKLFKKLSKYFPQLLRLPSSLYYGVNDLLEINHQVLWSRYQSDSEFTMLHLLWHSSRAFGLTIERIDEKTAQKIILDVDRLEAAVYEKERQDDPRLFAEYTKDPNVIYLISRGAGEIEGICIAAPLSFVKNIPLVDQDPEYNNPLAFYSIDLSVHPKAQGKGLGWRLKCEQYMEAYQQGVSVIRSRNRYPQAQNMIVLNRKLSAVTIAINEKDYGGSGTAYYQSIELHPETEGFRTGDRREGGLKNKVSLGNFVSLSYVRQLLFLKQILPEPMRHLYLTSGRAECVEKMLKLFRVKRPQAKIALSFKDDFFGTTTACARSLGDGEISYFNWPVLSDYKNLTALETEIKKNGPEKIFGVFVEPISSVTHIKKDEEYLRELIKLCHTHGVPVAFHETNSYLYRFHSKRFFASSAGILPDGLFAYAGNQLGFVASTKDYFLEKPLMMISTWDGDEHSLNLLTDKILKGLNHYVSD